MKDCINCDATLGICKSCWRKAMTTLSKGQNEPPPHNGHTSPAQTRAVVRDVRALLAIPTAPTQGG